MPTKDRRSFVRAAIRSVLAQSHTDFEVILYDVGERPIDDIIPDDPRIQYVRGEAQGPAADFQAALEHATGEIVTPLADDDRLPAHALQTAHDIFGDTGHQWLCGRTVLVLDDETPVAFRGGTYGSVEETSRGSYMLGGAIYWRKELTDRLGGFDKEFDGAADFDLYSRFLTDCHPVLCTDTLYVHYVHAEQDSAVNQQRQADAARRVAAR